MMSMCQAAMLDLRGLVVVVCLSRRMETQPDTVHRFGCERDSGVRLYILLKIKSQSMQLRTVYVFKRH